jgi:hypothetical protein
MVSRYGVMMNSMEDRRASSCSRVISILVDVLVEVEGEEDAAEQELIVFLGRHGVLAGRLH